MSSAAGQFTSNTLYSSEEFGYGGQAFGRAYDSSELTGDNGANHAFELRYSKPNQNELFNYSPYAFYDIGYVENAVGSKNKKSGASAGIGIRLVYNKNISGNFGIALPLTKKASVPIYGGSQKNPRLFFQLGYNF